MFGSCHWSQNPLGKFPAAIEAALGKDADVPEEKALTDLLKQPQRKNVVANSASAVTEFIEKALAANSKPAAKKPRV